MNLPDRMAESALRLIREAGASLIYRRIVPSFDPLTGATLLASEDFAVTGLVQEATPGRLDDALVRHGDRFVLLAAEGLPVVPAAGSAVTLDGEDWPILHVGAIRPGDRAIAWRLQVRR